jgi:hypothetical protein
VTARAKLWVCSRLRAEILGLNPSGCMPVSLCELRNLSGSSLFGELITHPEGF